VTVSERRTFGVVRAFFRFFGYFSEGFSKHLEEVFREARVGRGAPAQ